jgi:hypothetical protein
MFVNMILEENGGLEEEGQGESTTSDEEMEEEIQKARVAVDECYRRRAKRAGLSVGGAADQLLTEVELENLSEQLGDGAGTRARRREEIEKMS